MILFCYHICGKMMLCVFGVVRQESSAAGMFILFNFSQYPYNIFRNRYRSSMVVIAQYGSTGVMVVVLQK